MAHSAPMRVLLLHNRYRQPGGEDLVAGLEANMLRAHGVEVFEFEVDNASESWGSGTLHLGLAAAWSRASYRQILKICEKYRPHIAHIHNFWMKLSPSVHSACRASGAATVQSLHNFRLLCANAMFLRNGRVCEDCLGRAPWGGVLHRCYKGSFLASAAVARMIVSNRRRGTWERDVDAFIALSEHSRSMFFRGGLPADRIFVKPNCVEDPGCSPAPPSASDCVLYAGRLSKEKGVTTLLSAWAGAGLGKYGRLVILGDGPDRESFEIQAAALELSPPKVVFAGQKTPAEVLNLIARARVVVTPSIWYEASPRIVIEALSLGRPVLVSDLGALREIVRHQYSGFNFQAGDALALGEALKKIVTCDTLADTLGENARHEYLANYTSERNYETLMHIYRLAIERRAAPLPDHLRSFGQSKLTTDNPSMSHATGTAIDSSGPMSNIGKFCTIESTELANASDRVKE